MPTNPNYALTACEMSIYKCYLSQERSQIFLQDELRDTPYKHFRPVIANKWVLLHNVDAQNVNVTGRVCI